MLQSQLLLPLVPNSPPLILSSCSNATSSIVVPTAWQDEALARPDKDLESPSSTRLEALVPSRDSRARTRSPLATRMET